MDASAVLRPVVDSAARFAATVETLSDAGAREDSLVPPWTRGHVVTHIARATASLCRLLSWAHPGVETPQYASMEARAAEIEAGAARTVDALVADVRAASERFEAAVRALPAAAWRAEVRMRTGELRTPASLVATRLRELEIHHSDLDAGYTFADIPRETARWIIDDLLDAQARRAEVPALRIEATDTDLAAGTGTGAPVVRGAQADLLAWLTGRSPGAGLTATGPSGPAPVPTAPYWI